MSMDFTPHMLHKVDLQYHVSQNSITVEYQGKSTLTYDPNCNAAKKYPNTYFLAETIYKNFKRSYKKLAIFEQELTKVVQLDDQGADATVVEGSQLFKAVAFWYYGMLDPHFYYREQNDMKMCGILSKI